MDTIADVRELEAIYGRTRVIGRDAISSYIEAPFTRPVASRFSDGSYGVLYASDSEVTSAKETAHHLTVTYRDGKAPLLETIRVALTLSVECPGVELRRKHARRLPKGLYDSVDYTVGQRLGAKIREKAAGVHFDSVRNTPSGHCVGVFNKKGVRSAREIGTTALVWDGQRFSEQHKITPL